MALILILAIGCILPGWLALSLEIVQVDEAVYSACAVRLNLVGEWPLEGCRDSKPPILFLLYQAVFALFGAYDLVASRLLAFALAGVSAVFVAAAAGRLAGPAAGAWAAAIYGLAMFCAPDRVFLSTETAGQPFVGAALYLVIRTIQDRSPGAAALAGLAMAGAVLSKQPYVLVGAGIGAVLASHLVWPGALSRANALRLGATVAGTAALALLLAAAAYLAHGSWEAFWYQIYRYPASFSLEHSANFVVRQLRSLAALGRQIIWLNWMFIAIAAAGVVLLRPTREAPASDRDLARRLLLLALPIAYVAVGLGDETRMAYVAMIFPLAATLAGVGTQLVVGDDAAAARMRPLAIAALLLTALSNAVQMRDATSGPLERHGTWPIAREINAMKRPDDRLEVWGWLPHLYVATSLVPLARLSLTHMIVGAFVVEFRDIPAAERVRIAEPDALARYVAELRAHRGRFFLVDAGTSPYMGWSRYPVAAVPELAALVAERCERIVDQAQIKRWDWHPSAYVCRAIG